MIFRNSYFQETPLFLNKKSNVSEIKKTECFGPSRTIFFSVFVRPIQEQADNHSCGLSAITYVPEIIDGNSPTEAVFALREMRGHLVKCLENQKLTPFPKT